MNRTHTTLLTAGLLLLAASLVTTAGARSPARSRFVPATIKVDGEPVLRASTGDDGDEDADEVWNYLLDELDFTPTEHFASLNAAPDAEELTIGWRKGGENEARGTPPEIQLEVAYGGRCTLREIELVRAPSGKTWLVDRETVERNFTQRWITRGEAAELLDPKRKK